MEFVTVVFTVRASKSETRPRPESEFEILDGSDDCRGRDARMFESGG